MPIRFRCAYCNQLLGIARRKAGTVVRCPTCAGQVVVPNIEEEEGGPTSEGNGPFVFERNDFDELLHTEGEGGASASQKETGPSSSDAPVAIPSAKPPPGAWGTHAEPPYDVGRINPTPSAVATAEPLATAAGVYLSRSKLTVLVIAAIAALVVVFVAGLLIGYAIRGAPPASSEQGRLHFSPAPARALTPDVFQQVVQGRQIERKALN
jgi:hypothetical protein